MITNEYLRKKIDLKDKERIKKIKPCIDNKPPSIMSDTVRLRKKKQDMDSI